MMNESELPSIMASLDISEDSDTKNAPSPPQDQIGNVYVLRQRYQSSNETNRKRRCMLKPSKLNNPLSSHNKDCFSRRFKNKSSRFLETIYEEPITYKNGRIKLTGACKPRKIQFSGITKAKGKHWKLKVQTNKSRTRAQRKVNMDEFIAKFHKLMGTKEANATVDAKDVSTITTSSVS
ncbi:hypothetical protein R5R35_003302 [Gryllus longicercus]|uniref:Uncharacterized protein n=1 Tax=Gryllus longicercus TaxID=2509291 RepID=A0AAN9VIJ6_9ORTH